MSSITPASGTESDSTGHEEIAWFADLGLGDVAVAGGKGANLGELTRAGIPVPNGFVITVEAFRRALDEAGLRQSVRAAFDRATELADGPERTQALEQLRVQVRGIGLPASLRAEVLDAFHRLDAPAVAVRSSATAEDTEGASFAGMHESYANVQGDDALLDRLVACWASLYSPRAVSYRVERNMNEEPVIAVVVQAMAPTERAGVMFTASPMSTDADQLVIEAAYGLGELVVSGAVEPDTYVVDTTSWSVRSSRIGHQDRRLVGRPDGTVVSIEMDPDAAVPVLDESEVLALAHLGMRIQADYGVPQDVEWTIGDGRTWIVQSRPITTRGPRTRARPTPPHARTR